ncbi:unnamed protein product [Linum tenue]|uniref:Uncharacterized protein n=1 Tax=Linum tenue TaxID=586396 RepID=A0AAV0NU06_9ROSI|nr:unnamed protein product [Linum tenue]
MGSLIMGLLRMILI